MINKILVPVDFSEVAINALSYAVGLAQKCQAEIAVLHIKQMPMVDASYPLEGYSGLMEAIEKTEKEQFAILESTILKPAGISFSFHSGAGFVSDEVTQFANTHTIDLIVLGTKGASGLDEMLIGSNAASVIGKATVPVLVVPPKCAFKKFVHMVYASDFNEPEFPAVLRLKFFAELYDARITVIHAKNEFDSYFNAEDNFFTRNQAQINNQMEVLKVEGNDVLAIINTVVEDTGADFLVMAKHNRSFFDRLFHRSLTKQMAYHTKIPLLVLNK